MFDSLKCAKKLEEAGVPRLQAEAHVLVIAEFMETNFATKQDVQSVRHEMTLLRQEVSQYRQEFSDKMLHLEQRMTIKLGTIVSIAIGVAVGLAKMVG